MFVVAHILQSAVVQFHDGITHFSNLLIVAG